MTADQSRSQADTHSSPAADDGLESAESPSPGWMTTLYRHSRYPLSASGARPRG
ncbi:hypothetical protein [Herbiconiux daphne]|uniref:Uncharacterized protein n=1 Tax=Herbiconiux daphne TaxID=2970914 RepID=A0ABT2H5D8_9MICO|nr:hypothetical protein [Herbiconiux daphne]MCS5735108.1 hypothetical protein [Herbiconiux daphne]